MAFRIEWVNAGKLPYTHKEYYGRLCGDHINTSKKKKKGKSTLIMRGQNFKSGNCMVIKHGPLWDFIIYMLITSFSSINHKFSTCNTDLWKMMQPKKLQIAKITPAELQSVFTTHARNRPYWSLHCRTMPVQSGVRVINPIDHCTMPGQF